MMWILRCTLTGTNAVKAVGNALIVYRGRREGRPVLLGSDLLGELLQVSQYICGFHSAWSHVLPISEGCFVYRFKIQ
jgi:hypothetical protein